MTTFDSIPTPINPTPNPPNLYEPGLYINRELSWLEFNRRCLLQALDPTVPLLERVRFLSIFSNNLDEFFMVRVSGLKDQVKAGVTDTPADGLTPAQQLVIIREWVLPMLHEQRRCFHELLVPALAENQIDVLDHNQLTPDEQQALAAYFEHEVFPVLTPLAVDPGRPFPHISNLSLSLAVLMRDADGVSRFARIKVPNVLSRIVPVHDVLRRYSEAANRDATSDPNATSPEPDRQRYIFLENLIEAHQIGRAHV